MAECVDWTEEKITALREMWPVAASVNAIAREMTQRFRETFTKCSITGKAHRLNLPLRPVPAPLLRFTGPNRDPRVRTTDAAGAASVIEARRRQVVRTPRPVRLAKPAAPPAPLPSRPAMSGKCCWPMWGHKERSGGVNARFCCAPAEVGRPYCDEHHGLAYEKVARRKADTTELELRAA